MIKLENVRKHYESFDLNISMHLLAGRVTGLVGKNGAGKSTTFKAILGLIKKDSGNIFILGKAQKDVTVQDKENYGVVLAESGFSPYLSISDIIPIVKNMYRNFDEDFFRKKCKEFQLPEGKRIKDYSTGMKAKLRVLIAVSHGAKLLILDEPTTGLDVMARKEILELLREFMEKDKNNAILISSHISSDLENFCDDIYLIEQGKVILHEETEVLLDYYGIVKADQNQFEQIDKSSMVSFQKDKYGYSCLVSDRKYYMERYPELIVEKGNIDEVMLLMICGQQMRENRNHGKEGEKE